MSKLGTYSEVEDGSASVNCANGVGDLPQACVALFSQGERESFDLGLGWYQHLIDTALSDSRSPVIYYATGGPELGVQAVLPLCRDDKNRDELRSLTNFYTSLYKPLLAGSDAGYSALVSIFRHIMGEDACSVIDLQPMAGNAPVYDATLRALRESGWVAYSYFCFGNWYLPVTFGDFDAYWRERPSALRNTIERKRKRFSSKFGGRLAIVTGEDGLADAISAYERVYNSSWKKPEPYPDFIPGMIRMYAARGQLRLGVAYSHDVPVAAQIWIVSYGKAAIYKLAYDEAYSNLSAGSVLTAHLMKYVLDVDQVNEVDYLIGDEKYKQSWMSHRRQRRGIVAYNPKKMRGIAGLCKESLVRAAKRLVS